MPFVILAVLLALTLGYMFAKMDSLSRAVRGLKQEVENLRVEVEKNKK
jgi:outer membrane murein-binding lipoprotein Lpp